MHHAVEAVIQNSVKDGTKGDERHVQDQAVFFGAPEVHTHGDECHVIVAMTQMLWGEQDDF